MTTYSEFETLFSGMAMNAKERIILVEKNKIYSNELEVADIFNNYFNRITDSLQIPIIPSVIATHPDPVTASIERYASHPSIGEIKSRFGTNSLFELTPIESDEMLKKNLLPGPW